MGFLISLGAVLCAGHLCGSLAQRFGLPRISGYLLAGIVLNPTLSGWIPDQHVELLARIQPLALGLISFHIGTGLVVTQIRSLGRSIASITLLQSALPWLFTMMLILGLGPLLVPGGFRGVHLPMALLLSATATASAPAVIVAIIAEYRTQGPVTTTVLAVLALTDVVAVLLFAVSMGFAQSLSADLDIAALAQVLAAPLKHLAMGLAIGLAAGGMLVLVARRWLSQERPLPIVLGVVMLTSGLAEWLDGSSILANVVLGCLIVNQARSRPLARAAEGVEALVFTWFFVLNGMYFQFSSLLAAGPLALLIMLGRKGGKLLGAAWGARLAGAPLALGVNAGLALLPKAGLTLSFALMIRDQLPSFGPLVFNALVASTILNMLFTPTLARQAFRRADEENGEAPPLEGLAPGLAEQP